MPRWIWSAAEPGDEERIELERRFTVDGPVRDARLWATADNALELRVNGALVAESTDWKTPVAVDLTDRLTRGENVLAVWAKNDGGARGFCAELVVEGEDGGVLRLTSDGAWRARGEAGGASWGPAAELGELGCEPWGELSEAQPPSPSVATPGSEVAAPEGFVVELLYSVPRVRRGSWVSLTNDHRGRLLASDQYGALYRVTPPPLDATEPVHVERLEVELGEAQGLLHAFDSLYVVVNKGGQYESGLYRLPYDAASDRYGAPRLLKSLEGSGEHGPHAVIQGPGESLYLIAGNHTKLPEVDRTQVPRLWGEDRLGPHLNDPNGHAVGIEAPGGWVCRTDPDGETWELVAVGFRNAYDLALDDAGELFTYDSDMEWDVGMPWYRPTRVLHVAHGAEFGWRTGTDKWPDTHPDSLPPVVDLGLASPTGVLFGTGTAFPAPWRNALFVADWAYGTLHAVHLEPRGGSYGGTSEVFLSGKALPLTDLAAAGDGALYFTTGGRRTQSGLYRVRWSGAPVEGGGERPIAEAVLHEHYPFFKQLEETLRAPTQDAFPQVYSEAFLTFLGDGDRYVRYRYRTLLEQLPLAHWRDAAWRESREPASIEACLALVRADPNLQPEPLFERIGGWAFESMDVERLLSALRVVELALVRLEGAAPVAREVLGERFMALLPAPTDRANRELVRTLAFLQVPGVAAAGVELIEAAPSQETAIELALLLSQLEAGWTEDTRSRYLGWFTGPGREIEGGHSAKKYVERIRELAHETLGVPLPEEPEAPAAQPAAPLVAKNDWTLRELLALWEGATDEPRDLERGAALFEKATCVTCHRHGSEGGSQGPDLSGVASRFSTRDVLEALVEPSAVISDQYRDTELWTENGQVVVGRIEDEVDGEYVVRTGLEDVRVTVAMDEVTETRPHPLSRMPEDLLDPFEEDEVLDLLAFLLQ